MSSPAWQKFHRQKPDRHAAATGHSAPIHLDDVRMLDASRLGDGAQEPANLIVVVLEVRRKNPDGHLPLPARLAHPAGDIEFAPPSRVKPLQQVEPGNDAGPIEFEVDQE